YYLGERQSEALDAYQRLKTTLADDLGIDPGPTVRALHERILRQEPLDVKKAAKTTAVHTVMSIGLRTSVNASHAQASLRATNGRVYPLQAAATRIGRLTDNDIVLDDANVSRHHAVIIDTGTSFVISDLRSANGIDVGGERIRGTATLAHGDPDRESRVGSQIGPYRLRRLLGKGGMGEVYEAEYTVKDRIVALKLLPEAASHDPVFRKRLQREAHSAGRLQEPHVVPIHDYGEVDGLLYVDMRMIDGTDLRQMLKRYGPMTPARAVAIVRQIASALDAAHESGVMHRDVKPENILITRDDFAYLVDFGIANAATDEKLTELGTAVGTYAYMAPERFTNDEVTYRADVYALTCVLHECLT